MDRDCTKCIHHISGSCSAWDCEMETLEEHDAKVRADAIDDVERELLSKGFIFTHHALDVWHEISEQLKEQKK